MEIRCTSDQVPASAVVAGEPAANADATSSLQDVESGRCRPTSSFALSLSRAFRGMAPIGRPRAAREGVLGRFNRDWLWSCILMAALWGVGYRGAAQSTNQLPVYYVSQ